MISRVRVPSHAPLSKRQVRALLEAAQKGDKKSRDRLVESNLKLVLSVVRRFSGRRADMDDLFQVGCEGLIKAIEGFDLSYDVAFSTYAVPRIIGEIRRYVRDNLPIKVGRSTRSLGEQAAIARERLTQSLGRSPTPSEVAAAVGAPKEEVVAALDALIPPRSLDQPIYLDDGEPLFLKDQISAASDLDPSHDPVENLALIQVLRELSPEERKFVRLRYLQRHSQTKVAQYLGRSQAHVSRMERRLLIRLRRLWER